jgi:excisionase family DNA binding protein
MSGGFISGHLASGGFGSGSGRQRGGSLVPELFNLRQAAAKLGVSVDHLRAVVQDGDLAYINVGRGKKRPTLRFTQADLDDFVERRRKREVPFVSFKMGTTNVTIRKRRAKKLLL